MSCTNPGCYLIPRGGGSAKRLMQDWPTGDHPLGRVVYLPCGGCLACRRERRQELTLLQCCEASLHQENWFITLTYEDEKTFDLTGLFPYSLDKKHLSHFCESMRKWAIYNRAEFRFFAAGEYGDHFERPHYHISVFGLSSELLGLSDDKSVVNRRDYLQHGKLKSISTPQRDANGNEYWQSPVIADRWLYGSHKIYRANRETFQYVAGYVTKKLTGQAGKDWRASGRISEFQAQSRPSIGKPWFDAFCRTLSVPDGQKLVNDCLSIAGTTWRTPRIFDRWLLQMDQFDAPVILEKVKSLRLLEVPNMPDRNDLKRKADFDRYSAKRFEENKRSHKEV